MGKASSVKGAKAERDAARLLNDPLGIDCERKLGAGRKEDTGDLHGVPGFTVQVANRPSGVAKALRDKPLGCEQQQGHAGEPFGVTMLKLPPQPGGKPQEWRFVMTPAQFAEIYDAITLSGRLTRDHG
jgi:hypothetical protein